MSLELKGKGGGARKTTNTALHLWYSLLFAVAFFHPKLPDDRSALHQIFFAGHSLFSRSIRIEGEGENNKGSPYLVSRLFFAPPPLLDARPALYQILFEGHSLFCSSIGLELKEMKGSGGQNKHTKQIYTKYQEPLVVSLFATPLPSVPYARSSVYASIFSYLRNSAQILSYVCLCLRAS